MQDKSFLLYGRLSWLHPAAYRSNYFEWAFIDTAVALEDGEYYQILVHCERPEKRYIKIC